MVFDRLLCPVIVFLHEVIKIEQSSSVCHLVAAATDFVLMNTLLVCMALGNNNSIGESRGQNSQLSHDVNLYGSS
jgi:hypothetical protein